jgi:hypothetical protein
MNTFDLDFANDNRKFLCVMNAFPALTEYTVTLMANPKNVDVRIDSVTLATDYEPLIYKVEWTAIGTQCVYYTVKSVKDYVKSNVWVVQVYPTEANVNEYFNNELDLSIRRAYSGHLEPEVIVDRDNAESKFINENLKFKFVSKESPELIRDAEYLSITNTYKISGYVGANFKSIAISVWSMMNNILNLKDWIVCAAEPEPEFSDAELTFMANYPKCTFRIYGVNYKAELIENLGEYRLQSAKSMAISFVKVSTVIDNLKLKFWTVCESLVTEVPPSPDLNVPLEFTNDTEEVQEFSDDELDFINANVDCIISIGGQKFRCKLVDNPRTDPKLLQSKIYITSVDDGSLLEIYYPVCEVMEYVDSGFWKIVDENHTIEIFDSANLVKVDGGVKCGEMQIVVSGTILADEFCFTYKDKSVVHKAMLITTPPDDDTFLGVEDQKLYRVEWSEHGNDKCCHYRVNTAKHNFSSGNWVLCKPELYVPESNVPTVPTSPDYVYTVKYNQPNWDKHIIDRAFLDSDEAEAYYETERVRLNGEYSKSGRSYNIVLTEDEVRSDLPERELQLAFMNNSWRNKISLLKSDEREK